MSKHLRTCLVKVNGAAETLIKTTEDAPVIRKGQRIEVTGYGIRKVTSVRTEDITERGRQITLQWVTFDENE